MLQKFKGKIAKVRGRKDEAAKEKNFDPNDRFIVPHDVFYGISFS